MALTKLVIKSSPADEIFDRPLAAVSLSPLSACAAMEEFHFFVVKIIPPTDAELAALAAAWHRLTIFNWFSIMLYRSQVTLAGLDAFSVNCRNLRNLAVTLIVSPDLPDPTSFTPFCDGVVVDVQQWRLDEGVDSEVFIGALAALAPQRWLKDGTPWLSLKGKKQEV